MSITYVPVELRNLVVVRAEDLCEYCLVAQDDTFFGCEIDHIISEKHGGPTVAENLANACLCCNQAKGSDIGSIDWESGEFVRFFNPRTDKWCEHFKLVGVNVESLTKIGRITAQILDFNDPDRVLERLVLQGFRRYPSAAALKRIQGSKGKA